MISVSEHLKKGIDTFLEFSPEVSEHIKNTENPHSVTKAQVGLSNVDNVRQASKDEFDQHNKNLDNPHSVTKEQIGLSEVDNVRQANKEEFELHKNNAENPHCVTKEQVGLSEIDNIKQASKAEFDLHRVNCKNPHSVTKEQVGLSNVINEEQATKTQYENHVSGQSDKHFGWDVMYSSEKTINEKIEELIIDGGSGTMYHNELLNRDASAQHPMSAIENAGEVLLFEGVTTDETVLDLTSSTKSEFVSENGFLTCPVGTCGDVEISVLAAVNENGAITGKANVALFKMNSLLVKINSMAWINKSAEIKEICPAEVDNSGENGCSFAIVTKNVTEIAPRVTGIAGKSVKWKVIVRIKNILKVEA